MTTGTIGVKGSSNILVPVTNLTKRTKQLTLTVTGTNWTTTRAVGVFYADSAGMWRLAANVEGTLTAAGGILLTMTGVTFKSGQNQAITCYASVSANSTAIKANYVSAGASTFGIEASSGNIDTAYISMDVELNAEPTTYTIAANMENIAGVDVYIPFGQAGVPGEYIYAACSADVSTTVENTDADVTGMSITLTAGKWMIGYDATVGLYNFTGDILSFDPGFIRTRITNSNNEAVARTEGVVGESQLMGGGNLFVGSISRQTVITVAASDAYKTYKVRYAKYMGGTSNLTGYVYSSAVTAGLTDPDTCSVLWAVRIAP